ncbi:MAG: hypothetical protein MI974_29150 [Chitinophagales bacterium]|nr:hypothetical protein [Chitinophagales bacterium]
MIKAKLLHYSFILLIVFFSSCQNAWKGKQNEMGDEVTLNGYHFYFQYLPYSVMAERDITNGIATDYEEAIENYKGHLYGELTISSSDKSQSLQDVYELENPKSDWEKALNKLLFQSREEFVAFSGNDRLPCALNHAHISPFSNQGLRMSLVFKLPEGKPIEEDRLNIYFNDNVLTHQKVGFTIPTSNELISLNQ